MNGRLARARAEVERLSRQVDQDHVDILTLEERLADAVAKRDQLAEAILIDRAEADELQRETDAALARVADERDRLVEQVQRVRGLVTETDLNRPEWVFASDIRGALAERRARPVLQDCCPRCGSPDPARHPAVQAGGEVQPRPHAFHGRRDGESMGEYGVRLGLRPGVGGQPIEAIGDGDDVDPRLT